MKERNIAGRIYFIVEERKMPLKSLIHHLYSIERPGPQNRAERSIPGANLVDAHSDACAKEVTVEGPSARNGSYQS
jgi:hypothetical protein